MAQYTITYTCGHSTVEQIYGKTDLRAAEADRRGSRLCRDCYRTQQQAAAEAKAETQQLPALVGSDKQAAWAVTIRARILDEVALWWGEAERQFAAHVQARGSWPTDAERTQMAEIEAAIERLRGEPRASYWIDHRQDTGRNLVKVWLVPVVRQETR